MARSAGVSAIGLVFIFAAELAGAATIQVTTTNDENSSTPTNVVCSLREAVIAANTNLPVGACPAGGRGVDTIVLPAGTYTLTIAGAGERLSETGSLDVLDVLEIQGAGSAATIVDGNALDTVFTVLAAGTVTFKDVAIRNGVTGIHADALPLTLERVDIRDNAGVGLHTLETQAAGAPLLVVRSSRVGDNQGTGIVACAPRGGFGLTYGTVLIQDSVIEGNQASGVSSGCTDSAVVERTEIRANSGGYSAAGLGALTLPGPNGPGIRILDSTIAGNTQADSGVVLAPFNFIGLPTGVIEVEIVNSTFSGNPVGQTYGSGVVLMNANASIVHSTFADPVGLVAFVPTPPVATFANSLLQGGCVASGGSSTSLGGNVESPGDTCGFAGPGDQVSVASAGLLALAANGGPTRTHALAAGSVAIGAGLDVHCVATDQRGIARPSPATGDCDAGAYEVTGCNASLAGAELAIPALVIARRVRRRRPSAAG